MSAMQGKQYPVCLASKLCLHPDLKEATVLYPPPWVAVVSIT